MPSGKMIAWIVGLSLVSTMALEHFRTKQGGGGKPSGIRAA